MRCPKDANQNYPLGKTEFEWCKEVQYPERWICTRKKGHRGLHHTHTTRNECMISWVVK